MAVARPESRYRATDRMQASGHEKVGPEVRAPMTLDTIREAVLRHERMHFAGECDCTHHRSDRALLAEVDRLTADIAARDVIGNADAAWDGGVLNERARITASVRDLEVVEPNEPDHPGPWFDGWHEALASVLALVGGPRR